jgi:hypothetical protein
MHQTSDVEPSGAAKGENVAPQERRFLLQWSLQTLFLLTAAVAVWIAYVRLHQQVSRLEQEVVSMQQMARELVIEDREQIAVVMLPQMWMDESRWEVYLPEGEYMMRLATRQIDEKGLALAVEETPISAGRHRIELLRPDEGAGREITVIVDDRPLIETEESPDWDPGPGSSGGSEFDSCVQRSAHEPVVLFRRRFNRRSNTGRSVAPKGPTEGLMLWIEPVEPADTAGADL